MVFNYVQGMFVIVNTLISVYILTYAYIFLARTKHYPDRRPWEFLFAGSVFFLISQVVGLFSGYGNASILGMDIITFKTIIEFLYAGLILIAFITQSHLILMSDMILITSKVKGRKKVERYSPKLDLEEDIPLPNNKNKKK